MEFHSRTKVINTNHRSVGTSHMGLCIKISEVSGDQMTMQGLSLSQNASDVTKDDTKGKEEARASRHAKKNNDNKMELQGTMEELGNNVHCHGN